MSLVEGLVCEYVKSGKRLIKTRLRLDLVICLIGVLIALCVVFAVVFPFVVLDAGERAALVENARYTTVGSPNLLGLLIVCVLALCLAVWVAFQKEPPRQSRCCA